MNVEDQVKQLEELWKKVDTATAEFDSRIQPQNSFTATEYAKRHEMSTGNARKVLAKAVKAGRIKKHARGCLTVYTLV